MRSTHRQYTNELEMHTQPCNKEAATCRPLARDEMCGTTKTNGCLRKEDGDSKEDKETAPALKPANAAAGAPQRRTTARGGVWARGAPGAPRRRRARSAVSAVSQAAADSRSAERRDADADDAARQRPPRGEQPNWRAHAPGRNGAICSYYAARVRRKN